MVVKLFHRVDYVYQLIRHQVLRHQGLHETWIDVGVHFGEHTFQFAKKNPSLMVYAFEPNLKVAIQRAGLLPNFVVIPAAIAENDGCANFFINTFEAASSLLPFDQTGLQNWIKGDQLTVERTVTVPTIRLDTFMNWLEISNVDFLKVDAQGADFSVIKSAGKRLKDIRKITLEVAITPSQLYLGAAHKSEVVGYLEQAGFALSEVETQSYNQEENLTFIKQP